MFNLIKFGLKKYKKQYKIFILFLLILFFVSIIFFHRYINQNQIAEKQRDYVDSLYEEMGVVEMVLKPKEMLGFISDEETKQLQYLIDSGQYVFQWKTAIYYEKWDEIPKIKKEFLERIKKFEEAGGKISDFQGKDLQLEIEKNNSLLKNNLAYEDYEYSILPQLVLYEVSKKLFSIAGIILIIFLFGLSFSEEYEDNTISTLKTQPITMKKILFTKIISVIIILMLYILFVFLLGFFIPFLFRREFGLNYPLIHMVDDLQYILSVKDSILRLIVVFFSLFIFTLSIVSLFSVLTKDKFRSIILSAAIFLLGTVLINSNPSLNTIFNPFFGLKAEKLMVGGYESILKYSILTILISIGIIMISELLLNKTDIAVGRDTIYKRFSNKYSYNSSIKRKLIIFENRKSKRNNKIKNAIIVSVLLALILSNVLNFHSQKVESDYILRLEERLKSAYIYKDKLINKRKEVETGEAAHIKQASEEYKEDAIKEGLAMYDDFIESKNKEIEMLSNALDGYEAGNLNKVFEYQMYTIDQALDSISRMVNVRNHSGGYRVMPESAIKATKSQYEIIFERKLEPMFPGEALLTAWGNYNPEKFKEKQLAKQFVEENEKYDSSGLYSLYLFYNKYIYIIPIILLVYLKGLGLNYEIGKKKPLNLMRTQPIKLEDIYNGKLVNGVIDSFLFIFIIFIVIILSGTILNRFGDLDYPILCYDLKDAQSTAKYTVYIAVDGNYHFIDLGLYLFKSIILTLVSIVFLLSFTSLISNIGKNRLITMILSIIIVIVGYMISLKKYIKAIFISPFIYLNIPKIINGEMAWKLNNGNLNFLYGIVVLGMYSILCWILGKRTSKLYERD